MNPSDIHIKLKNDLEFENLFFFSYFENISYHSLPDLDYCMDPKIEPCIQHPPIVPDELSEEEMKDWSDDFVYEIKLCVEVLQRHTCRKVCHKYGNEGKCSFMFPHEIVDKSYFDKNTNSVILVCHDATIDFFFFFFFFFGGEKPF